MNLKKLESVCYLSQMEHDKGIKNVFIRPLTAMLFQMGIICEAYDRGTRHVSEALILIP